MALRPSSSRSGLDLPDHDTQRHRSIDVEGRIKASWHSLNLRKVTRSGFIAYELDADLPITAAYATQYVLGVVVVVVVKLRAHLKAASPTIILEERRRRQRLEPSWGRRRPTRQTPRPYAGTALRQILFTPPDRPSRTSLSESKQAEVRRRSGKPEPGVAREPVWTDWLIDVDGETDRRCKGSRRARKKARHGKEAAGGAGGGGGGARVGP
ncbi:uncharacterized protein PSFLO_00195 [Pseudozyma flocculosa]|uniref:Uncharacterized protein n=1 Tax=Pseudozyma flocculosa TaxID=84751 RepID=A0A5C3EQR9_9BASI|nr:uncharacterized protein PSFLO_00195 [Pseudozyma flocculosa]